MMEIIIAAISGGGITAAIGVLAKFVLDSKKEKHSEFLANNDQAVRIFGATIDSLKKDLLAQESDLAKLQQERLSCREICATLTTENKYLLKELEQLRKQ